MSGTPQWADPRAPSYYFQVTNTRASDVSQHPARSLRFERRGATFQSIAPQDLPVSPGGLNNDETDSGPACVRVSSDACTGGSSPNGTDARRVHLCKPIPNPAGELGAILGGHREADRSGCGEVVSRRDHP